MPVSSAPSEPGVRGTTSGNAAPLSMVPAIRAGVIPDGVTLGRTFPSSPVCLDSNDPRTGNTSDGSTHVVVPGPNSAKTELRPRMAGKEPLGAVTWAKAADTGRPPAITPNHAQSHRITPIVGRVERPHRQVRSRSVESPPLCPPEVADW